MSGRSSFWGTNIQRKQRRATPGKEEMAGVGGNTSGKGKEEEAAEITKEEGVWACKADAPRDTEGTTSELQLLSPAEACHLLPSRS